LTIRANACEMIGQPDELSGGNMASSPKPGAIRALLSAICRSCAAPALAFALAVGIAAPASAQDKEVDLRLSLWVPPAHPLTGAAKAWAEDIAKASNGTIKITVFPSEQLGKAFDHYDMARDDIADITYVNPGYQPGRFPIIAIGQMPFTFGDARKGTAALDSWYRKYAAMEMKDTHFCFAFIHDPGALHSRKKIVLPQDLRGAKVRPAQSTIAELVTNLGGTNVQASAPEAREVLERGVADAITFPWGSLYLFGIDKVVKHHIDAPLYTTVFTFSMNKDKYESMSTAQKKVMDDHCSTDWAVKIAGPWGDFESAGRDKMRADPKLPFRAGSAPTWAALGRTGVRAKAIPLRP
jgi:TRAP-type C4-dicarboxylate transport system substrate-binding protein